jgi:uncharacterized Zn finger protein
MPWGYDGNDDWQPFPAYVPAAVRRKNAEKRARELAKKEGRDPAPVRLEGKTITTSFWGKSWCENLERYSDFATRLPRGRSYVRSGCVVDLRIAPGRVDARVSGSLLYEIAIDVKPLPAARWRAIRAECAGRIDSMVALLEGSLSEPVMTVVCRKETGLFPAPAEISMTCSCPDSARMCKHVAATLYGIGARLDKEPELVFILRGVNAKDLLDAALASDLLASKKKPSTKRLAAKDLSAVFGIDLADDAYPVALPKGLKGRPKK